MVAALVVVGTVGAGGATAGAQELDGTVRVAARKLAGGQVEVALQQHTNGSWAERLLPDRRLFPADAAVESWLLSTPRTIDGGVEPAVFSVSLGAGAALPLRRLSNQQAGRVRRVADPELSRRFRAVAANALRSWHAAERPSNGRIEGTNNLLQVLRRSAHGFTNPENFAARGLLVT